MAAFALCASVMLLAHGASAPSSSLLADALRAPAPPPPAAAAPPPASMSLFYVPPPEPRSFQLHDLVQIIVRETSTARSSHELETEKEFGLEGEISDWPHLSLTDLLNLQLRAGKTSSDELPRVGVGLSKEFTGEGEYERRDDLVGRISAEVIEVLPNGNLVLESRTMIATDDERQEMRVTGICRPADVTAENSILSSQIHDLRVEKVHSGELKKANEKGIVTRFFDFLFAW